MNDAILALLILLPLVLTVVLKSNGALVFLSLCAGYVAETLISSNVQDFAHNSGLSTSNVNINLFLLAAPLLLTILLTTKNWTGRTKMLTNGLAALAAGTLLALVSAPLLNAQLRLDLAQSSIWDAMSHVQSGLIGAGIFYSLVLIWFSSKRRHDKKHKS